MKKFQQQLLLSLALWVCVFAVHGQVEKIDKNASPLEVTSALIYTDNLNPTLENEVSAYGIVVSPKGKLVYTGDGLWFMADYEAQLQRFRSSEELENVEQDQSFNSARGRLLSRFFVSDYWLIDAEIQHSKETQRFGTGITSLREDVRIADELTRNNAGLGLVYGSDTSSRFMSLKYAYVDYDYEAKNAYSELFNLTQQSLKFDLSFRRSSLTKILLRLEARDDDFENEARTDSKFYEVLAGIDWKPSGKTQLEAYIGSYRREFASSATSSGLSWLLELKYQPADSWLFELSSTQTSDVSKSETTSDTLDQDNTARISYLYSEQWKVGAYIALASTEFVEEQASSNLDELKAGLTWTLSMKKHNQISVKLGTVDVSGNGNVLEYSQNEARLDWRYEF
jgi:hypothetical protein